MLFPYLLQAFHLPRSWTTSSGLLIGSSARATDNLFVVSTDNFFASMDNFLVVSRVSTVPKKHCQNKHVACIL